ncbi:unnamed protein product [Vitrella brassicaformis CCMP3155]|uniref:Uncharacterized protein n=1 Tax=Vitrella brassicaformis (strain CCMP3155) TaxID=1169540 RepID=A0A0G4EZD9_VITBC|nr:unnamed protein product [Vitrella brassicaformis CCMP3155]|eukprot:CEM04461.1 unnamed protein product [Vitrella brassicaformis CCMP3155]
MIPVGLDEDHDLFKSTIFLRTQAEAYLSLSLLLDRCLLPSYRAVHLETDEQIFNSNYQRMHGYIWQLEPSTRPQQQLGPLHRGHPQQDAPGPPAALWGQDPARVGPQGRAGQVLQDVHPMQRRDRQPRLAGTPQPRVELARTARRLQQAVTQAHIRAGQEGQSRRGEGGGRPGAVWRQHLMARIWLPAVSINQGTIDASAPEWVPRANCEGVGAQTPVFAGRGGEWRAGGLLLCHAITPVKTIKEKEQLRWSYCEKADHWFFSKAGSNRPLKETAANPRCSTGRPCSSNHLGRDGLIRATFQKVGHVSRPSQLTIGGGRLLRPYPVHHEWLRRCLWCGREA